MTLDYLDSSILIYYFDQVGPSHDRAALWLDALLATGDRFAVSDLVRMECRVRPLWSGDSATLAIFDRYFATPDVRHVPLTATVFDRAAQIRAGHGFRTPDAIHLAAAIESGCERFLTNDIRLSRLNAIAVETLP